MEVLRDIALREIPEKYQEMFLHSFDGGKRIRPLVCREVCSFLGKDFSPLRKAALAVEVLHCSTLLHDDVVDKDSERRGRKAFHENFSQKKAILFGDYFATKSIRIIQKNYPSILGAFLDALENLVEGQLMEFGEIKDMGSYLRYAEKKTASLFELSASIPQLFYGLENRLGDFGKEFGIAFQIANDLKGGKENSILGIVSREEAQALLKERVKKLEEFGVSKKVLEWV